MRTNYKGLGSMKYDTGGRVQVVEKNTFECRPLYVGEGLIYSILRMFKL